MQVGVCSLVNSRAETHQQNTKMCEVIAETAGLIGRDPLGFTAAAAPTTLPL